MKNIIVVIILLLVFLILLTSCLSGATKGLGVKDKKLKPCPATPNCISTQADPGDKQHYMPPLKLETTKEEAIKKIVDIINSLERTKIVAQEENYIRAEFTSKMMKFVDDVEFYIDEDAKLIHFRSASRVGISDIGVNRARMENIVSLYNQK